MTKLTITTFWLAFATSLSLTAQPREKVEALRIAIYTQELQLTTQEATVFWPIFNEYLEKQEKIKLQFGEEKKKFIQKGQLSDEDAEKALDLYLEFRLNQLNLEKEYIEKLKKAIPVQKVLKLQKAETKFKKALIEEIKNRP